MALLTTFSKLILSESTDGRPIAVVAIATPGDTIHTAGSGSGDSDEIYIYAVNNSNSNKRLTLEWGDVTGSDLIEVVIPANAGAVLVAPGWILRNSLLLRAFAQSANDINITGFVNRINVP